MYKDHPFNSRYLSSNSEKDVNKIFYIKTMFFQEFSSEMVELHSKFLEYIDDDENDEENYQNLINVIKKHKFENDQHDLKTLLYLISKIAKSHYRHQNFLSKIEKVIKYLQLSISKYLTNFDIFNIFKGNKLILLFLIQEKVMSIDKSVLNKMQSNQIIKSKYMFFMPEVIEFINQDTNKDEGLIDENFITNFSETIPDDFFEQRKIGQNEKIICNLIRNDSIGEFITYVKKEEYSLVSKIEPSMYESNSFLIKNTPTLIEYAAFFGSIQIFKYLYLNKVILTPSLWIYGIHGDNPEIFNILEEQKIIPADRTYGKCLEEAIKCHHNHIANYIQNNFRKIQDDDKIDKTILSYAFHYYNFAYFTNEYFNHFIYYYACKYDYFKIVDYFYKTRKLYVKETIMNLCFQIQFLYF